MAIVVSQGIVTIVAVAALIVSMTSLQASREHAALDNCRLIRGLVLTSTTQRKLPQAVAYLKKHGLYDCTKYAQKVVK